MSYKEYQKSRNAAWQLLLDCHVVELPVDLNQILRQLEIGAYPYQGNEMLIRNLGLENLIAQTEGLSFFRGEKPVILYDRNLLPYRIRFTVAHELGHIILGHVGPGEATKRNQEPGSGDGLLETAANQFAARLLAPACVLWGLDLHTASEISSQCHISYQAAMFRAKRMEELYRRNKFLTSPLEQKVYHEFLPFIEAHRHHY